MSETPTGRFSAEGQGVWTKDEHARFLAALELYPNGPWKKVAELVRTRSTRQTMTHAQKHKQKLERHRRGLRAGKRASQPDLAASASASPVDVSTRVFVTSSFPYGGQALPGTFGSLIEPLPLDACTPTPVCPVHAPPSFPSVDARWLDACYHDLTADATV